MRNQPTIRFICCVLLFCACLAPVRAAVNILFVTTNNGSLTAIESGRKTMLEAYGYTVNTIWDGAPQATFNTAFANNRAIYLPDEATAADVGYKLREATIGIFSEHTALADELGFCSSAATTTSSTTIAITNNTHYIMQPFATGSFTLASGACTVNCMAGTTAPGGVLLATVGGVNSVVAIETAATLANTYNSSNVAFGRRVQFPLPVSLNTGVTLSANTYTMASRMIAWAAGLDRALVAHWKLNETSGTTAADSSDLPANGTVTGTATWTAAVLNNGFQFNGATRIQATGLFSNPKNVTLAAWANLTSADSSGSEVISLGDHIFIRLDEAGNTKASIYNGSAYVSVSLAKLFAGTGWHHFAAMFDDDNNSFTLYVDGVQAATMSTTNSISYAGLGTNTVIGRHGNSGTNNDFTGIVDDVRVYNYALTASEIAQVYGFVGHWKLSETSGTTAADSTIFARNGAVNGGASWATDCGGTPLFDFDGSSHYISIANASNLQPTAMISIAAWIKGDAWGSGDSCDAILRKGDANPNNYQLAIADGRVALYLDDSDAAGIRGNTVLSTGRWYHAAATWDGATVKVYVNGQLDNTPVARTAAIATDTRPLLIGGRPGADQFDGMIRDVRLYSRPLTSQEIVQLAGLVGHWKFAEGTGTSAADSSSLANNATLSGGASWTTDCAGNNNALLTNGTGGIARTNAMVTPPDVGTVAFWMRSIGAPAGTTRILGVGPDWEIRHNPDGRVISDLSGDGATTIGSVTPLTEVNRWYHFAATFDSSNDTYAIYVDGKLEMSGTNPSAMIQRPADYLSFGTRTGSTEYWNGALRDVRIYNRKLCPTEIAELYGLVGHWKLDETSGPIAADSSGIGNHGTYAGSPTLGVTAPNDLGTYFPSNGTMLIAPASASLNSLGASNADFCVAFWVRPSAAPGDWRPLLHKGSVNFERGPGLWLNPGNTRIHFKVSTTANNNEGPDSVANLATGAWSHVTCVKVGNKWRCYINGVLDTEFTLSGSTIGNNGPFYFGDDPWYGGSNVRMDDIRVYNRALCPSEVQTLHSSGDPFEGVKIIKWTEIQ